MIKTIFYETDPEIGEFVHLAEIDPDFVGELDAMIVDTSVTKYMDAVVGSLNKSFIDKMIKEIKSQTFGPNKVSDRKVTALKESWKLLLTYVKGLKGLMILDDKTAAEQKWKEMSDKCRVTEEEVDIRFSLPTWAKVGLCIPLGIPYGIYRFIHSQNMKKASQEALENVEKEVDACQEALRTMYENLQKLEELKTIIKDKENVNNAFNEKWISIDSFDSLEKSMRARIGSVGKAYGSNKWGPRVELLAEKIVLTNFDASNSLHRCFLLANAYLQIEPDSPRTVQCTQDWMGVEGFEFKTPKLGYLPGILSEEEEEIFHIEETKASDWLRGWSEYLEAAKKGKALVDGAQIDQTRFIKETQGWAKAWRSNNQQDVFANVLAASEDLAKLDANERTRAVSFISKRLTFKTILEGMECFKFII